jgi:hypothetical protein
VYVDGEYGFTTDQDKAVYPGYHDALHCREFQGPEGGDIYVGIDFGLTPAATFMFRGPGGLGQWRVHSELVTEDMGAAKFAVQLSRHLRERYPQGRFRWHMTGDPAGDQRSQANDEWTAFRVLQDAGLAATPAHTQDATVRHDAVARLLQTLTLGGEPALVIHPDCRMLRRGLMGGYRLKRVQVGAGEDRWHDKPVKDAFSHVCEALEYGCLGAGEGTNVVSGGDASWHSIRGRESGRSRANRTGR